jgi:uncharacterized short protein YbdD (DUF466 family)
MALFVVSEEPGGTRAAASGSMKPDALRWPAWRAGFAGAAALAKGFAGLDDYERYLRHERSAHPDHPPMSEADFWRNHWDDASRHPKARCC